MSGSLRQACTCVSSSLRSRSLSTAAQSASIDAGPPAASTSSLPSRSRTRLLASALVSRPPVLLPALSDFERSYYKYQRTLHHALSGQFDPEWYFRRGSAAEASFQELDARERLGEDPPMPRADGDDAAAEVSTEVDYGRDVDVRSLRRQLDRTVYLLVKKSRAEHAWQLPQGVVEDADASLVAAAERSLAAVCGRNLDTWTVGKVPAGVIAYASKSSDHDGTSNFIMPMHILRGQVSLAKSSPIADFAWLTREEVEKRVDGSLWSSIRGLLNAV